MELSILQIFFTCLIFAWAGFVRSGLGFGGAVLGLPFMLLVAGSPIDWLPLVGLHLLFFSGIHIVGILNSVDWLYLRKSLIWIMPGKMLGVVGLLSISPEIITYIVYLITICYAFIWFFDLNITPKNKWLEKFLLFVAGYLSGTSLSAGALIVSIYLNNVSKERFRNTLFILWFILVAIKMSAFAIADVLIDWRFALFLLPYAAIGHYIGLKAHNKMIAQYDSFKYYMAIGLFFVCLLGILNLYLS